MDYEHLEANLENFSGTDSTFNQPLSNGKGRGFYGAKDKKSRATIQIQVDNFSATEQIYELFNSNNSIAIQPDDSLYAGKTRIGEAFKPFDADAIAGLVGAAADGTNTMPESIVAFSRKGNLLYVDSNGADLTRTATGYLRAILNTEINTNLPTVLKISMKSTLQGNTYRRFIEKMKTSVIHVIDWKIQCLNEQQFQLPIGQKDFSITGAASDDEFQLSSSISSKDFNTKIVEISDKQLLIDGDTRISGIILPNTSMVFTFSVDIINEVTKSVFR